MDAQIYLDFALEIIKKTRVLIKNKRKFTISKKSDASMVTEVDREVELLVRSEIERKFPEHGIVGEEFGIKNKESEYQWLIDPIDGTRSFCKGIPLYGTILALHYKGTPLVGVIDHPDLDTCYYAVKNGGAFCNGEKIKINDVAPSEFEEEIIATSDRKHFKNVGAMTAYESLLAKHSLVRTIPDCFGHTLAVKGAVGAMIDFNISAWDVAATQILVEEAGGTFLVIKKFKLPNGELKYNIICGKPIIVSWLVDIFRVEGN